MVRAVSGAIRGAGPALPRGTTVRRGTAARIAGSVLAALFIALGPGPAIAPALGSCAPPRPIEVSLLLADAVVVGVVTHLENGGRWITVRVEERWRGPETMPDTISVRAGPEPGATTSGDRVFAEGRYLLFLSGGPEAFTDDACSATTVWTEDLAALRPAGVSPAADVVSGTTPAALGQVELLPVVALVGALAIVVVSYFFILRARRRPPDWMR